MIHGLFFEERFISTCFLGSMQFLAGLVGWGIGWRGFMGQMGFLNGLAWACELLSTPTDFMFHGPSRFVASFHHVASTEKRK